MSKIEKNIKKQQDVLNKERDERCLPVAEEIIKRFGTHKHLFNSPSDTALFDNYNVLAREILSLAVEHNLKPIDVTYVQQLVSTALANTFDIALQSINKHLLSAQDKAFGCRLDEIPMKQLHELLGGAIIEA